MAGALALPTGLSRLFQVLPLPTYNYDFQFATNTAAAIVEKYEMPMVEANGAAESIFNRGFKYTFGILSPGKMYLRGILVNLARELRLDPARVSKTYLLAAQRSHAHGP